MNNGLYVDSSDGESQSQSEDLEAGASSQQSAAPTGSGIRKTQTMTPGLQKQSTLESSNKSKLEYWEKLEAKKESKKRNAMVKKQSENENKAKSLKKKAFFRQGVSIMF